MSKAINENVIVLETPIKRGETLIESIELRRPGAGELRGLKLADVLQLDVDAAIKLLPRITAPALIAEEVARMDPADLLQCASRVAGFLLRKSDLQDTPSPAA
ncbi:phage tail assembly protein [Chromobacterium violaceum]|uniref:phage tail assembly protein n=1 Tax=Chromobacterium violaceum TaxID=536 RepID=UPI00143CD141|nr:phage tail assembly protein [Chromobacterium violaceum]QIY78351.1 phage tail assembly protein [Chromobacterium violaceum]